MSIAALDRLWDWAVPTSMAITLLILLVLILRRPVGRVFGAQAAYVLWMLPILRLFMPTIAVPELWLFWRSQPVMPLHAAPVNPERLLPGFSQSVIAPLESATAVNWAAMAVGLWLCGGTAWLIWHGRIYVSARGHLLSASTDAPPAVAELSRDCAKQLGLTKSPIIKCHAAAIGPMVLGLLSPAIVLPRDFTTTFNPQEQRYALLHEMAHIKRRDLWAAAVALCFRALNWPNPLVHYAYRGFRFDQEAACDATVMGLINTPCAGYDPNVQYDYGQTLLKAAKLSTSWRQTQPDIPIGLALHHPLKERIMILKHPIKKMNWHAKTAAFSTILIGCLATASYSAAQSDNPQIAMKIDAYAISPLADDGELAALLSTAQSGLEADKKAVTDYMASYDTRGTFSFEVSQDGVSFDGSVKEGHKTAILAASQKVISRCADHAKTSLLPHAHYANLALSGTSKVSGEYMITCTPGAKEQRDALTIEQEVAGIMGSDDIPIKTRQARAYGMEAGYTLATIAKRTDLDETQKKTLKAERIAALREKYQYGHP